MLMRGDIMSDIVDIVGSKTVMGLNIIGSVAVV